MYTFGIIQFVHSRNHLEFTQLMINMKSAETFNLAPRHDFVLTQLTKLHFIWFFVDIGLEHKGPHQSFKWPLAPQVEFQVTLYKVSRKAAT